jgi:hypothetical protein
MCQPSSTLYVASPDIQSKSHGWAEDQEIGKPTMFFLWEELQSYIAMDTGTGRGEELEWTASCFSDIP